MQESLPEQAKNEDAGLKICGGKTAPHRGVGASIWSALALLALDVVFSGSFLMSSCFCPIWFLVSIVMNTIQRPGWRIALLRITIPAVTLGLVLANDAVQFRIAERNASLIVAACEKFHAASGRFPRSLDELVPRYMPSVPRAKYCLNWGEFHYLNNAGEWHALVWCVVPPFGQKIYVFEKRQWNYID